MVNWKVVLIVLVIAILLMAIGMWLGYRYISEQDDIHYEVRNMNIVSKHILHIHTHINKSPYTKLTRFVVRGLRASQCGLYHEIIIPLIWYKSV